MLGRRSGSWLVTVALLAAGALVMSGDVGAQPSAPAPVRLDVVGATAPVPLPGGVTALPALPSADPATGFEAGGGGLAGSTWGLFGDPGDGSAVLRAAGVQVDLAAPGWGPGAAEYAVFEAGTTTPLWPASGSSTSSIVPAGILRNGGAYQLVVTVAGVTTRRAFTIDASRAGTVAGEVPASVASTPVSVNTGQKMGLGLQFSSADVGVTAGTGAIGRLTEGLPAGWSWSGVGADVWKAEVVDGSASLPGVNRIVKVYGGGVLVLGCAPATAGVSVCDTADGQLVGEGPRAVVRSDGSVVLTEQSAGQALTFDPDGRVVRIAQPGTPPVAVSYTGAGGLDAVTWEVGTGGTSPVWDVFYPGDADCDDSALPAGFVATPSGFVCGWREPAGTSTRVLYSNPAGGQPRVSRIVRLPPDCAPSMVGCDPNLSEFSDFGWDASNRLVATRDTLTARAVLAGLLDPADASHWQAMTYDGVGRRASTSTPTPVTDDRGRLAAAAQPVVSKMVYAAAEAGFAPATQQVAVTTSGAEGALTTTTAVDDGARVMAARAAAGAVTRSVWAPYDDVLLATIYPNQQAETTVYDRWFRRIGKHTGPIAAFGTACAPTSPQRGVTDPATGDWTACAAPAGTTRATSQLIAFDEPSRVENGLTAAVFAPAAPGLPSPFSGNPTGHAAADQLTGAAPGVSIAAVAPAAPSGSGVRLDGGLVVPTSAGPAPNSWDLEITAPADLLTTGVVVVNGRFCAVLDGGAGSCAVSPDARAQHLTIDLELARVPDAADQVVVELQDPFGDSSVDNSFLVRRWSADTTLTKIDPLPAGTIADWSATTTTTHEYDCGAASAPLAEQVACIGSATTAVHDPGGVRILRSYAYEADGFGGVRLASATKPDGTGQTTFTHWGIDDTAAGLPNADQLGDLASVPQRGLPRTTTLPGGRSTTTVHDEFGTPVCQSVNGGNWTCTTLDVTRRPTSHVVRADTPGVAPVTITTDYAPAGNPLVNRTTRTTGSRTTLTEQTTLAPSGRVLEYTDSLNTTTAYGYDGVGRLSTTTITPPAAPGRAPRPRPPGAAPPGFTFASQFDPASSRQTGITFSGQPLVAIGYDDPEHPWLPTGYTYTLGAGTVSAAVNYDSDLNPFGRTWTLADGSTLLDCATAATAPTACTADLGDAQPGTTASGRMLARTVDGNAHRFTYDTARRLTGAVIGATTYGYTWDLNNNRKTRTVDGATTTFTYNTADQLTATTDSEATIGGFDADQNHTSVGADTYTYDALDQLASTTNSTTGATIALTRDAQGRITTHRTTPRGTYYLGYSLATDQRPTLTIDATGAATPLLGLPGGLLFRGGAQAPLVTDMQGNTLLALTVDGRRPTTDGTPVPVQQYDPFGAPTPDSAPAAGTGPTFGWQQNQTDGPVTHVGVRALHTRLGTFLQPDPRPHGSSAGPYSYTNADPVNQADATGLCVGWGCVKEADQFLQPIADAVTLLACVLGFGIACFVTSLIRVAISVLNFAADFELHQDAAYDGVTLALSFLNLAAATPLLWEARLISTTAQEFNLDRSVIQDAVALRDPAVQSAYAADAVFSGGVTEENLTQRFLSLDARLSDLASWGARATTLARGVSIISVVGEYGARITSGTLYNCCWKLW